MKIKNLALSAAFILIAASCTKSASTSDCSTVGASYKTNIQPIVAAKCATAGCHAAGSLNGDLTTYSGLQAQYSSGKLKKEVITNKTMPQNGSLSTAEYQAFDCWISAGGQNN